MKELVFLPDREGRDELGQQHGFVRVGADGAALESLSDRLILPPCEEKRLDVNKWRGLLTLALLCDAWPGTETHVTVLTVDGATSAFASWVLSARGEEKLHLVLLEKDGMRKLLGIADGHMGITLPAVPTDLADMMPARAAWYDADEGIWHDPVPSLNENDRAILLARLTLMGLDAPEVAAFKSDLADADKPNVEAVCQEDEGALRALALRIQAVCALDDFEAFSVRREPCAVEGDNPLVRLFAAADVRYPAARECAVYLWNGVPFARTSAQLGLTGVAHPGQDAALDAIEAEVALLGGNSTRWCRRCGDGVAQWLAVQDAALLPQARARAEEIRNERREKAAQVQPAVQLTWPWDAGCGAVKYLLNEALGSAWMAGAKNPFADVLTKLTGHTLGDNTLQHCCACADGVLLPPLSKELARCVASAGDGEGLATDTLRFDPREDGGITASFLLRGTGEVRMERTYPISEILVLDEGASPCAAVWPCLPMERWRAYHVFMKGGDVTVSALAGGSWKELTPGEGWRCLRTDTYPACLVLTRGESCLGVLPNALPLCRIEARGDALAAIDMGASATAAVLRLDGKPVDFGGDSLTRLLVTPQDMPAEDFLESLTPMELTPSAVMLTGDGDQLFEDGYVYAPRGFDALREMIPGSVCSQLKWRADKRSVRARRILLHQVMLGASLTAMLAGAKSIRWRMTVADEMADEGRDALLNVASELSVEVAEETGLYLTDGKFMVTWAEEASAVQSWLRRDGGMKGTFAVLDIGGSSVKTHLWMQGKHRPLGGAVMLTGASSALLEALRDRPEMLYTDFADCGDAALISAVEGMCAQLTLAGESTAQADKALLMLDALLQEHKAAITQHMYARFMAQQPTYMQAVLLEMYASALFNVGLMLEQAGNDTNISHLFPSDLNVCLTGRGAWLMDTLTPQLRNGLQYIAHEPMQLRHPVRTVTLRVPQLPAMGVALGMVSLKETQMTNDTPVIRTRQSFSELMRMLMVQFFQCFPLHVWTLHPGLFDQWGNLTAEGDDIIRRTASAVYGEGEDIPASVMAFMAKLRQTAILPEFPLFPGE